MDFRHAELGHLLTERLGNGTVILRGSGDLRVATARNLSQQQMEFVVGAFNAGMYFAADQQVLVRGVDVVAGRQIERIQVTILGWKEALPKEVMVGVRVCLAHSGLAAPWVDIVSDNKRQCLFHTADEAVAVPLVANDFDPAQRVDDAMNIAGPSDYFILEFPTFAHRKLDGRYPTVFQDQPEVGARSSVGISRQRHLTCRTGNCQQAARGITNFGQTGKLVEQFMFQRNAHAVRRDYFFRDGDLSAGQDFEQFPPTILVSDFIAPCSSD